MARIEASWRAALSDELAAPSMQQLHGLLDDERRAGHEVYPSGEWIFAAFDHTPLERVRVVIVGQDPYHGPGQATGLAFGVPPGVAVPPSLRNVFTELADDLGIERPAHGDLTAWADRGVLLLNTSLTVRAGAAGSHSGRGWEQLTDAALRVLAERRDGIAFLLWGRHAQVKQSMVDPARHLVLTAAHPSPLSASRGFFGCRHFSRVNEYLGSRGQHPIDWTLPV
jgi:uracil-DNA glycosylase